MGLTCPIVRLFLTTSEPGYLQALPRIGRQDLNLRPPGPQGERSALGGAHRPTVRALEHTRRSPIPSNWNPNWNPIRTPSNHRPPSTPRTGHRAEQPRRTARGQTPLPPWRELDGCTPSEATFRTSGYGVSTSGQLIRRVARALASCRWPAARTDRSQSSARRRRRCPGSSGARSGAHDEAFVRSAIRRPRTCRRACVATTLASFHASRVSNSGA